MCETYPFLNIPCFPAGVFIESLVIRLREAGAVDREIACDQAIRTLKSDKPFVAVVKKQVEETRKQFGSTVREVAPRFFGEGFDLSVPKQLCKSKTLSPTIREFCEAAREELGVPQTATSDAFLIAHVRHPTFILWPLAMTCILLLIVVGQVCEHGVGQGPCCQHQQQRAESLLRLGVEKR